MPFYYSTGSSQQITATANTDTDLFRFLTVSPRACQVVRVMLGNTGATAQDNQLLVQLQRMSTASTVGSAVTPQPHDPAQQAAITTAFTLPTIGTKLATGAALQFGFNSRSFVQWVALVPDEALYLATAGGANGNIDLIGQEAGAVAVNLRFSITHWE